ncbi:hypothetical protein SAMN02787118_13742 [Streptomyces mirabilis]|uniref:LexA DNA binding domain-containing protein n=1 Tax=Streptomyces mirabilis TaxID=68239 RepID=A0A1I2WIR4_9ACTN|nr:hypothetical protein SAMN02787118_13742 [Streptomyces mirabilis]
MNRRPEHLTAREEQILRCIRRWIEERGEGPSVRQLTNASSPLSWTATSSPSRTQSGSARDAWAMSANEALRSVPWRLHNRPAPARTWQRHPSNLGSIAAVWGVAKDVIDGTAQRQGDEKVEGRHDLSVPAVDPHPGTRRRFHLPIPGVGAARAA